MAVSRKKKKIRSAKRGSAKRASAAKASNSNESEVRKIKQLLVRHISREERRRFPDQDLSPISENMWAFIRNRPAGKAKIRAFNPSLKKEGYTSRHTVILIANDDMPFLVDSITGELNRMGLDVHLMLHPIVSVARDNANNATNISEQVHAPGRISESWMYVEVDETPDAAGLDAIVKNLEQVLQQVRLAVRDWQAMRAKTVETLTELPRNETAKLPVGEREEAGNFLAWLEFNHFTFLGMRDYRIVGTAKNMRLEPDAKSGLGILDSKMSVMFFTDAVEGTQPSTMHQFLERKQLILVTKTHRASVVHRTTPMDAILIKRFDDNGKLIGERLFVGLFTSSSYSEPLADVPMVRSKVAHVVEKAKLDPVSHDGKTLIHILNSYPRDELFQISADELYETAMGILELQQHQRVALFVRHDPFGRFVSCLIFVPRELYETKVRQKFQDILLEAFHGAAADYNVKITDDSLAQIFIIIRTEGGRIPEYDLKQVELALADASRSWSKRLQENLVMAYGENQGLKFSKQYANAFSDAYRDSVSPSQAMSDMVFVQAALKDEKLQVNLHQPDNIPPGQVHLKWYSPGAPLSLAHILPLMRNMGLDADAVTGPHEIRPAGAKTGVWIQDCQARLEGASAHFNLAAIKPKFEEALICAWNGLIEDDSFNKLILLGGLAWREVVILRAIGKYLRQAGFSYGENSIIPALSAHPAAARLLVDYFVAAHDPDEKAPARAKKVAQLEKQLLAYLDGVNLTEHDTILRRYLNTLQNILRTNYFQKIKGEPKPYLSFKLDSLKLEELPLPRPMVEIFVYSPQMEGIHLRGGKVARGGIRWSDRREDFRTEVLSLMKAQMVKNTVIVPVGSKGGFVVKSRGVPSPQEGVASYQTLIRGMLDITDNRKGSKIIPPAQVVRYDEDDPYLVVAADKGTAKFSDIANAISLEYGFWLGDAFASGGSVGYDHKEMGITARGAWEAVKRHFREMGKDIQKTSFTVVGVGDMSGDVFGNAMLLSPKIRLLAAFNHKHIFIDPDPDLEASFAERKRLFHLPASQWTDYDKKAISKGGGVYVRNAKTISLSRQARDVFGITTDQITPDALLRALLKVNVELLWFGGIGTFVKSEDENNADAGDRANDSVRVNAEELHVQVIGEGANLGMTQRSRIAFARNGGRINTDAIDNSAGVDTSDHEVNIKILLDAVMQSGELTLDKRNKLLARMTEDVGRHVLRDNYLQTLALTLNEKRAAELLPLHARLITQLERAGLLNRWVEFLPDDEEIQDRLRAGTGLSRPELAVLMAYAKISIYNELLASTLPDNPGLEGDLFRYFPVDLQNAYPEFIRAHRLRREIIATFTTNSLVNRAGIHFTIMMKEKTGKTIPEIVSAYTVTRQVYDLRPLWRLIERLDNVASTDMQNELCIRVGRMIERTAEWYLNHVDLEDTAELAETHKQAVDSLRSWLMKNQAEILDEPTLQRRAAYIKEGVPEKLVDEILLLPVLGLVPEILGIAHHNMDALEEAAALYFAVEKRFQLFWLRAQAQKMAAENHWQREAVANVMDDLYKIQTAITRRVLAAALPLAKSKGKKKAAPRNPSTLIDTWVSKESLVTAAYDALLTEISAAAHLDLAMFSPALRHLNNLIKNDEKDG